MIIIGLGNPGKEYDATRHNLGFRVLDAVAVAHHAEWTSERDCLWAKIGNDLLIKPQGFMNDSGPTLRSFFEWKHQHVAPSDIIVVHDDLDLPVGTVKPDTNRSSGGHHGVASIIDTVHTQDFHRVRIGIGSNRPSNVPAEDYVLRSPTAEEQPAIDQSVKDAAAWLLDTMEKKNTA